ncbi:hypothetical protein C8J57DRAFT_1502547 [Mycena rebaudengoi]|nr:hypothetical protein C8J57DRAFT_1502547 [Mycena rebaudengoi]
MSATFPRLVGIRTAREYEDDDVDDEELGPDEIAPTALHNLWKQVEAMLPAMQLVRVPEYRAQAPSL